jgi:protein-disulfide isomerase
MQGTRLERVFYASSFAVLSLALGGASCDKKSVASPTEPGPSVPFESPGAPAKPASGAARPAAEAQPVVAAKAGGDDHIGELLEKLPSPCGKAMSLKKTLDTDPACKQGPFARRFVERLAGSQELTDDQIGEFYRRRYANKEPATFSLRDTPFLGAPNAPVVIVEFFDYACPHCKVAAPMLEELVAQHGKDVALYFKNYPLHKESMDAAKASVAAARQGKFLEMHKALFAHQGNQSREEIAGYAKDIGLDLAKFQKDWSDPGVEAKIKADKDEGARAKLEGTPTLFLNGRMYADMLTADSLNDWIEEEMAVNR